MGRPISYEMQMMFVGSSGAFEEAMNTGSGISRLDFIQSYDFSFNIERTPLKQIGSDSFATRQTQLAPDVNLNIQYYLNDGWNDKYIGLDIPTGVTGNPFDSILSSTGDRNFYISIAQNDGIDQNLQTGIVNSNILAIGNAYITNYEISVAVNQLATVSCSFVGANANVQDYATSKYLPSVNTLISGQNAQDANKNFSLNFVNNSRTERYLPKAKEVFDGGCPYSKCKITPDFQSGGGTSPITFGFFDTIANNFQSMQFSVQFERKALYGFGNNHPYIRKIQRPTVATLSLSALIDDFQAENLSKVFHAEGGTQKSMLIEFFNFQDVKKFGLSLQNLTLESYNLGARIGDRVLVETNWSVEVRNGASADIGMIGSYGSPLLDVTKVNESFSVSYLFSDMALGSVVSYGVDRNGYLLNWGDNSNLENGTFKNTKRTPKRIFNQFRVKKIDAADESAVFLDENGKAWGWGGNFSGQLGDNSFISKCYPVAVYGNKTFCQIAHGNSHTIAVDKNGKPWGWGYNPRAGNNQVSGCSATPVAVLNSGVYLLSPLIYPYTLTFSKITANNSQSLAIDQYGKAWAWGNNTAGVLGTNTVGGWAAPYPVYGNKTFCEINTGNSHTIAIDKYGKLWAWGRANIGQLGIGLSVLSKITPVSVCTSRTFCQVAAGFLFSAAIDNHGLVWTWGGNSNGELGTGDPKESIQLTPRSIGGGLKTFCKIFAGSYYAFAIDYYGKTWAWGRSDRGVLGSKFLDDCCTPKAIAGSNKTFCQISQSSGIDKNGKAWLWGPNQRGELGNNSFNDASTPVSVYGNKTFCKIARSYYHGLAIDKNGKAWGWGYNGYGQIGLGSSAVDSCNCTPVAVAGNKTFCKIFTSFNRSYGIDKNNIAWGWGYNGLYNLGIGTETYVENSPRSLITSRTFCHIEINTALDNHGQVWGWGYSYENAYGFGYGLQLVPVSLSGNKTFCKINEAGSNITTIDKNGKMWRWGPSFSYSPTQVFEDKTFCEIFNAGNTLFAIDKNGKSWAWGDGSHYTIGDGVSTSFMLDPTAIYGNRQFVKMDGSNTVSALDSQGKIWTWGSYADGALGQNTPLTHTPINIDIF